MDIQAEKLRLIEWLTQLNDATIISKLNSIRNERESDWWDSLTDEQKQDVEAGISDLEEGRTKPFDAVVSKFR